MTRQAFAARSGAGRADHQNLGVGRWVVQLSRPVACARDNFTRWGDQNRTDGHLAPLRSFACFVQGGVHMAGKGAHGPFLPCPPRFAKAFPLRGRGVCGGMTQENPKTPEGDRIAKVLARAGVASRREAERMIQAGRVSVNGSVIDSPALNVTAKDQIMVDEEPLAEAEPPRLWLYHKPSGLVTTAKDEKGRKTVFDSLPEDLPRVMSVGRLDLNSEGLLLLTNDGEIKRKLELPSTGWVRKYRVRVKGEPSEDMLKPLRKGITVEGERFQPMTISLDRQQGSNAWMTLSLREGKNREIRRAMEAIGLTVNRLLRVSYGPFRLGELKAGEVEEIKARVMRDQLGMEHEAAPAQKRAAPQRTRPGSAGKPDGKPGGKPTSKPVGKPGGKPARKFAGKTGGKDNSRFAGMAGEKPVERGAGKPAGRHGGKPAGKPMGKPGARPMGKPSGKPGGRPTGKRSPRG